MLYDIIQDFSHPIFKEDEGPFISLYQQTHRSPSQNKQDILRFKNLMKDLEQSLSKKYSKETISQVMHPLKEIKNDQSLWGNTQEGLVLFANLNYCVVFLLQRPVKTLSIVSDTLHTKPLIRFFQTLDVYHILAISQEDFILYEGNRDKVKQVILDQNIQTTKEAVLGKDTTQSYLAHASYGGASGSTMYHGHQDKKAVFEKDIERFFSYADDYVYTHFSKENKIPLILCALDEHHNIFKKVSVNPHLLEAGIKHSTKDLKESRLKEEAWHLLEPIYNEKIEKIVQKYKNAQAKQLGTSHLADVVKSAVKQKIQTILIEEERIIPGKIDPQTGKLSLGNIDDPTKDDVLDDLAQLITKAGGDIYVLEKEKMPSDTGVAALYRY